MPFSSFFDISHVSFVPRKYYLCFRKIMVNLIIPKYMAQSYWKCRSWNWIVEIFYKPPLKQENAISQPRTFLFAMGPLWLAKVIYELFLSSFTDTYFPWFTTMSWSHFSKQIKILFFLPVLVHQFNSTLYIRKRKTLTGISISPLLSLV